MKRKVFNIVLVLSLLIFSANVVAQPVSTLKVAPATKHNVILADLGEMDNQLELHISNLEAKLSKLQQNNIHVNVNMKAIQSHLDAFIPDIDIEISDPEMEVIMTQSSVNKSDDDNQAAEKTKTFSKTYSVDANDKLSVNNQYGKVLVKTWSQNQIKVDVEIKAYESSDSKAQDLLESVNIAESKSGNLISFKTNFDKSSMNFWSRTKNGKEERRGLQVNYTVYMPSKNPLDITNKYGNITVPELTGPVNINSSYGSFTAVKLNNPANQIKVSYGSAALENFSAGNLNVSYGSLKLENADQLNADIKYGSAKIGRLTGSGNIDLSYTGGFKIDEVDKNVKSLIINSSYSGVTLGLDDAANFDFDVTVSYAGFNYNDNKINITTKTPDDNSKGWNPTKNYKGHIGKGSDSRIMIKSNYGGVKFL